MTDYDMIYLDIEPNNAHCGLVLLFSHDTQFELLFNSVAVEKKSFSNWSSFIKWKKSYEATTYTSYVRPNGFKLQGDGGEYCRVSCND